MRDFGAKYIIAIDVSSEEDKSCTNYGKDWIKIVSNEIDMTSL